MKLYLLHGFAGECADWDEVIRHLPDHLCVALTYPFKLPSDGILIGYSMGGRIALSSPCPKIIISGHPGLQTPEEREARAIQEQAWIQKLKTVSISEFFHEWYNQPLFASLKSSPNFSSILQRRLKQPAPRLIRQMTTHSQATPAPPPRNAIFIHGALDHTYRDLYLKLQLPLHAIQGAGHACHLENPLGLAHKINTLLSDIKIHGS